jgi:transcriptional regulator with XRE-family HTH domain
MSDLLGRARLLAGLSRSELAAIAGVAPSTVVRIESGEMVPTVAMLDRLLGAAGYRLESRLVSICDVAALAAFRSLIEPSIGLAQYPGVPPWIERWRRAGFVDVDGAVGQPARLAELAGMSAALVDRPGLLRCVQPSTWVDAAARLRTSGLRWAATGGVAANRLVPSADAPWFVFYVDDPVAAAASTGFERTNERGPKMALLPFAGGADVGLQCDADGNWWADPIQVLLDCFGGTDRMPDQGAVLASEFGWGLVAA